MVGPKSARTDRVDCPGCFAVVRPRADGACPSCGADAREESSHVAMAIGEGTDLPELCLECAGSPSTRVRVQRARRGHAARAGSVIGRVLAALGWIAGFLIFRRSWRAIAGDTREPQVEGQVDRVELSLPACDSCRSTPPRVVHEDFRAAKLSVVVHRRFRAEARKLRRARRSSTVP